MLKNRLAFCKPHRLAGPGRPGRATEHGALRPDHNRFSAKQATATRGRTELTLRKPPRAPGKRPRWDRRCSEPHKVRDPLPFSACRPACSVQRHAIVRPQRHLQAAFASAPRRVRTRPLPPISVAPPPAGPGAGADDIDHGAGVRDAAAGRVQAPRARRDTRRCALRGGAVDRLRGRHGGGDRGAFASARISPALTRQCLSPAACSSRPWRAVRRWV